MKIRPVGAELFHADRLKDMRKPIDPLRNFARAHKNGNYLKTHNLLQKSVNTVRQLSSCLFSEPNETVTVCWKMSLSLIQAVIMAL
jgi:hypothetical protein